MKRLNQIELKKVKELILKGLHDGEIIDIIYSEYHKVLKLSKLFEMRRKCKLKEEDIIFQIRINRKSQGFDLVKKDLNRFEQSALEQYLKNYLESIKQIRVEDTIETYFEEE